MRATLTGKLGDLCVGCRNPALFATDTGPRCDRCLWTNNVRQRIPRPDDSVCAACGSVEVEVLDWVDANTGECSNSSESTNPDDTWCRACEEHAGLVSRRDWKRMRRKASRSR